MKLPLDSQREEQERLDLDRLRIKMGLGGAPTEKELPREAAPILAALMESLIAQKCPDSVSGYAIFDAMWPEIQAYATRSL